jgi:DNA processing protein
MIGIGFAMHPEAEVSGRYQNAMRKSHGAPRAKYTPPPRFESIGLWKLLAGVRRIPASQFGRLVSPGLEAVVPPSDGPVLYCAGDLSLVQRRCVAIVGSRAVSAEGRARTRRLARELSEAGVVVASGLAEGVDREAHTATIEASGKTFAVIGTPLDKAYPVANAALQEQIYREHLLLSPFRIGTTVYRSNFPQRNKFMAALTDATVIMEASDTSGSLHQAAECRQDRLDRWLFIARSVVDDSRLSWPKKFLGAPKVRILDRTEDILAIL